MSRQHKSRPDRHSVVRSGAGEHHRYEWGSICWMVCAAQGNSSEMTFGKVTIRAGMSNGCHFHPNCEETLYLIAGQLEHWVGHDSFEMLPGDTVCIPAGLPHRAVARGAQDAVMVVAYSSAARQIKHTE